MPTRPRESSAPRAVRGNTPAGGSGGLLPGDWFQRPRNTTCAIYSIIFVLLLLATHQMAGLYIHRMGSSTSGTEASSGQTVKQQHKRFTIAKASPGEEVPVLNSSHLTCETQNGETELMPMHASELDVQLFTSVVANPSAKKYLEFGCGGSTEIVAKKTKMSIVSVDSSTEWLCKVKRRVQSLGRQNSFTAIHVNIGKLKGWGKPADRKFVHAWPDYSGVSRNHTDADVVFVDGRFRVACILQTILFAKNNPTIVVHDFWNRPGYHEALPFLHVVNKGDSLMAATIKPDFDRRACQEMLARHILNPKRL